MTASGGALRRVVVIGAGMVGHRLADELGRLAPHLDVQVLGDEAHQPYNRVLLTELVAGRIDLAGLTLPALGGDGGDGRDGGDGGGARGGVRVRPHVRALRLDRARRVVVTTAGDVDYDVLVLATGATARLVDVPGLRDGLPRGAHVVRRLDDARDIAAAALNASRAVVVGAGPLGLETACALRHRGVGVTLVAPSGVLGRDLDAPVADVVSDQVADLGIDVVTGAGLAAVGLRDGRVASVGLTDGRELSSDLVVLACGSTPDIGLAVEAGLETRTGILVDGALRTSDPSVLAIGDCAETPTGVSGLVAPGWDHARAVALALAHGADVRLPDVAGAAMRLKAVGMSVVTMGVRASTAGPDDRVVTLSDRRVRRHVELVTRGDRLVGVTCVGAPDLASYLSTQLDRPGLLPADPLQLLMGASAPGAVENASPTAMPATTTVCRCNGVTKGDLVHAWDAGATSVESLAEVTRATTGCGGCTQLVCGLVDWLATSDPSPVSQAPSRPRETNVPAR
jgi:assimilatory nitrate reductase electron transfer subunit